MQFHLTARSYPQFLDKPRSEFTLLVAGCRGGKFLSFLSFACPLCPMLNIPTLGLGKTSFLRLLLDTSEVSPNATKEQLASVAKFVQGCSGHTSYIRATSIDMDVDTEGNGQHQRLGLTLIDTPSLDFDDGASTERLVSETMRHIDSRFAEGVEDVSACSSQSFVRFRDRFIAQEWRNQIGDRYVHL